ncbi:type II toxin-antitoxin system RelE family toxin [Marinactinospora rubrisoli]|uniref:Type II toxin-antitoxin system RelE/ParE family toxin n=1 Tax=Marinactinospora rubrisoli TaxID=2715399 RepID=A0ABW2KMF0_9ACTN
MSVPYDLRWSRNARRAVNEELPEGAAAAALELILGPLREEPRRVDKPLREPFTGLWSARRATYRVVYRIDEDEHLVVIEDIGHGGSIYRPR